MEKNYKAILEPGALKEFLRSWNFWRPFLGTFSGGIAGFLYYHYVGCNSGSCPITSHSFSAIIFGGIMGYLITSILFKKNWKIGYDYCYKKPAGSFQNQWRYTYKSYQYFWSRRCNQHKMQAGNHWCWRWNNCGTGYCKGIKLMIIFKLKFFWNEKERRNYRQGDQDTGRSSDCSALFYSRYFRHNWNYSPGTGRYIRPDKPDQFLSDLGSSWN